MSNLSFPPDARPLSGFRRMWMPAVMSPLPGVALCSAIAVFSWYICRHPLVQTCGVSALVAAMAIGIAIGNTVYGNISGTCATGVALTKQKLLRLGIVLYGARLTFHDIGLVGVSGVMIDALMLTSTFGLALLVGRRFLKLDRNLVLLIGAGSSICGAAAVLATDPIVKARTDQVTVAVSTVVIFGTLATFLYPLLYQLNGLWPLLPGSVRAFGIYAGSTIHEVAQVVAAARSVDAGAVDAAVVAKMVRVMMLCPFLLALALHLALAGQPRSAIPAQYFRVDTALLARSMPWFAVWFIAMVALNSALPLPAEFLRTVENIDTLLLMMAMAALGLTTRVSAFKLAGVKPLLLAAILFAWLTAGGAWVNHIVARIV